MQRLMSYLILMGYLLITSNFCGATALSEETNPCIINLSWGHGGAARVRRDQRRMEVKGKSIFQGCGVGSSGDIKYQAYQAGFNGDTLPCLPSGTHCIFDNGGFTPILTEDGSKVQKKVQGNSANGISNMTYESKFKRVENKKIESMAKEVNIKVKSMKRIIQSVGFTRLTHYNWAALMKEASDLIEMKECKNVTMNFVCHSEYKGANHGTLDQEDYDRRIKAAQLEPLIKANDEGVLNNILLDYQKQPIKYEVKTCATSASGTKIKSIPMTCNETHLITKKIIDRYKKSTCGDFLEKVTRDYKDKKRILNSNSLFNKDSNVTENVIDGTQGNSQ